nr:MAG TPA: hypothetical protein [Caudoviricetes sp.]
MIHAILLTKKLILAPSTYCREQAQRCNPIYANFILQT